MPLAKVPGEGRSGMDVIDEGLVDLVINVPRTYDELGRPDGYLIRRRAVDAEVSLVRKPARFRRSSASPCMLRPAPPKHLKPKGSSACLWPRCPAKGEAAWTSLMKVWLIS